MSIRPCRVPSGDAAEIKFWEGHLVEAFRRSERLLHKLVDQ